MKLLTPIKKRWTHTNPFQWLPRTDRLAQPPTYRDAAPAIIEAALRRCQARPSGNWFAFAASTAIAGRPLGTTVAGADIVAWRGHEETLHVGPATCPHLGADLSTGRTDRGALVCPWHGMRFDGTRQPGWKPHAAHDDGVLAWVRLDTIGGEEPTQTPISAARPHGARLHAVTRLVGVCEPRDIIANRLDPWHGAWYHPYAFTRLEVLAAPRIEDVPRNEDRFLVAVTFRIGRLGVPVLAEFSSPEPRTVVMRIIDGEGTGSVVETHATPLGFGPDRQPRTAVIEAVIAHSDRPGFATALCGARVITPLMRRAATRLWRDDLAYAERRYYLRQRTKQR